MTRTDRRRFPILLAIATLALAMVLLFSPVQAQGPGQSISEGDTDLPNDKSTPGRLAVGGSATGVIGTPGDQDRFAVELEAGRTYLFDLTGSQGGGGTLPDTFLRAIYSSEEPYQPDSHNDDFEGSRDSRVTFTPTQGDLLRAGVGRPGRGRELHAERNRRDAAVTGDVTALEVGFPADDDNISGATCTLVVSGPGQ